MPIVIETQSEAETRRLGVALGQVVAPGDVLLLLGTFGAGKTTLVKGLAEGLSVDDIVTSPSFVIANEYVGRVPLYHLDLYRIDRMDATTREALVEYFGGDGVCAVEWPAAIPPDLVPEAIRIALAVTGDDTRSITLESGPPRVQAVFARWPALAPARS